MGLFLFVCLVYLFGGFGLQHRVNDKAFSVSIKIGCCVGRSKSALSVPPSFPSLLFSIKTCLTFASYSSFSFMPFFKGTGGSGREFSFVSKRM